NYLVIAICLLLSTFTSCSNEETIDKLANNKIAFQLTFDNSKLPSTRSQSALQVRYQIADSRGQIIHDVFSSYNATEGIITIEPLPLGSYTLYVLAYNQSLESEGFQVNEKIQSITDTWFSFANNEVPVLLQDQLYYKAQEFVMTSEISMSQVVNLHYLLSGVDIEQKNTSMYMRHSMTNITLEIPETASFYTGLSVNGAYQGTGKVKATTTSFLTNHAFYLMPQRTEKAISTNFILSTKNPRGEMYQLDLSAPIHYQGGLKDKVSLDFSAHPDAQAGMLYISQEYYDQENRGLIFQDDEHHDIYTDPAQRSFYINKTLQVKGNEELDLHTRFYSARPIKDVFIWSSAERYGERILLAYYDSIPAFCDAHFNFNNLAENQVFLMESNERVKLSKEDLKALLKSAFEIECNDPYWMKLQEIRAVWYIYFNLYGCDPTKDDGGPSGNWRGIRPVHIREAVAAFTNIAYLFSSKAYSDLLDTYQGRLYGNGGLAAGPIDVRTVIPALLAHKEFRTGLTGRDAAGLGGGYTFGVYQGAYLWHYGSEYFASIYFHEMAHCIGYSHSSSFATSWAWDSPGDVDWDRGITAGYYGANFADFPVPNASYLNSGSNPNRYASDL
ncbi:MAG: hypothetical protein ACRC8J_01695, partial [Phocaeicola sp.]